MKKSVKIDVLLKNVAELKADQKLNREILRNLVHGSFQEVDFNITKFKSLESFEEIISFEENLKCGEQFETAMKRCGGLGGKDFKDAVRRILSLIFSHKMAMSLSWNATHGKESIQRFPNILLFIIVSLRSNKEFKDVTDCAVQDVIKRWLRQASDRNGGRVDRMKRKLADVT